jgi:regulator of nonsense transcripts 3
MSTPAPKIKPKSIRISTKENEKSKDRDKDKDKDTGDTSKEEKLDRFKTVVRRLPPNLPEEVFWQSVQTWVTEESVTWKVFYPGKLGKQ